MKTIASLEGVDIIQKNYQQVIIRGDGKEEFNQLINKEISLSPPSKNLEVVIDSNHLFAKQSFDQWSLIYLIEQKYKDILKFISNINSKDEILASDYSYGQIYYEVTGKNRNEFLNKLTHFDFRTKKIKINKKNVKKNRLVTKVRVDIILKYPILNITFL